MCNFAERKQYYLPTYNMSTVSSYFSGAIQVFVNIVRSTTTHPGRRKAFLFFFTLVISVFSFCIMRKWTYVPTYTHFVGAFAPMAKDTTDMHFVTADIEICTRDAFSLSEVEEEPYLIYHSCAFRFERRKKLDGVTLAEPLTSEELSKVLGFQGVFTDETVPPKGKYDGKRLTNVGVFAHAFTAAASGKIIYQPLELREVVQEVDGFRSYQYQSLGIADLDLLQAPAFRMCKQRLSNPYFEEEAGELIPTLVQMASDSLASSAFIANYVETEKECRIKRFWEKLKRFFEPHNLAVSNYAVYCVTDGVDSIHLRFSTIENAEFSMGTKSGFEIGRNYVAKAWDGDTADAEGVSMLIEMTARFQESENTQQVRMFFITTLCAASFGFFMKYLIGYFFQLLRFIHKIVRNEKKR